MKKILALLLAIVITLSIIIACTGNTSPNDTNEPSETEENSEKQNESMNDTSQSPSNNDNTSPITFEGTVVVDNDSCSIKITEIDPDNIWGYTLKVEIENKSADKTLRFSVEDAAVNGVQCDPLFSAEVAAGKKAKDEISFYDSTLEKNGIVNYTDIELSFRVSDSDDWSSDPVARETVHIYPYGESKAELYVRDRKSSDNVIVDNEYVTVIVIGYRTDKIWGYAADLFLLNKTDSKVMFSADDVSVNGLMIDPFWATSVSAGKCAFSSMTWSDSNFEENDITVVEEIELRLKVRDYDSWLDDKYVDEIIVLNP